jgi:O-antigen ligase
MVALVLALFITYAIEPHSSTRPARRLVNVLMVVLVAVAVWTAFSAVRPLDLTGDSGRIADYALAMSQFASHPLLGIGLGVEEYRLVSGSTIPHNLLFQLLAQTGLYGTIGMFGSLFAVLLTLWRYDSRHALVLLTCLIGGLFIPDLLNSRFVPVLLSLSAASLMDPVLPRAKVGWAR